MESLNPDNASILVCGGGGIAFQVAKKLKDRGSWVWLMQRNDSRKKDIEKMNAIFVKGDGLDINSVDKVFSGLEDVEVVISSIGGTVEDPRADSEANINLINAAVKKGVKKFVLITSLGCGDTKDALNERFYSILKPILIEKEKAESHLITTVTSPSSAPSQMTAIIIRPGGLLSDPATGQGVLLRGSAATVGGSVSREDVAELVVRATFAPISGLPLTSDGQEVNVLEDGEVVLHNGETLVALDSTKIRRNQEGVLNIVTRSS
eukprot:CAMPEP_0175045796 /NCGR_PEP_ID=MMETSP0052_2-20121109/4650_1 /TAXON_ID=51329 ORGANISM="Polytomella parva, Strain SAG 63-3" /NCGR_SAMPLE_ID=MMETSP0052_2 /ASSEMBLY_ACC=CAM_ASM_000194 /LENGTH=263 /DNA_ID=CAMNT_0016309423 /DNA_START=72 /DNA_END=863 /DNA_ORIENTATION=+